MYIYLTVSLIQIAFFVAYCSCLSRKNKLTKWQKEFMKDIEFEENFQDVLRELRKTIKRKQFSNKIKDIPKSKTIKNASGNIVITSKSDWNNFASKLKNQIKELNNVITTEKKNIDIEVEKNKRLKETNKKLEYRIKHLCRALNETKELSKNKLSDINSDNTETDT